MFPDLVIREVTTISIDVETWAQVVSCLLDVEVSRVYRREKKVNFIGDSGPVVIWVVAYEGFGEIPHILAFPDVLDDGEDVLGVEYGQMFDRE